MKCRYRPAGASSGDVKPAVAEEILDASGMVSLKFYLTLFDRATAGKLRFQVRRETIDVHVFRVKSFDYRYLFSITALVDADGDLLGFFCDVFADAKFLRQPARRADFRHYAWGYETNLLNIVGCVAISNGD
jgi:hypothetical protein